MVHRSQVNCILMKPLVYLQSLRGAGVAPKITEKMRCSRKHIFQRARSRLLEVRPGHAAALLAAWRLLKWTPAERSVSPCYRRYRFSRFLASGLVAASVAGVSVACDHKWTCIATLTSGSFDFVSSPTFPPMTKALAALYATTLERLLVPLDNRLLALPTLFLATTGGSQRIAVGCGACSDFQGYGDYLRPCYLKLGCAREYHDLCLTPC